MSYFLSEPQATGPHGIRYVHTGRGGAGNTQSAAKSFVDRRQQQQLPPSSASNISASSINASGRYTTGRGGSGNVHTASERPMSLPSEDIERMATHSQAAPAFLVGRGGAGNWAHSANNNSDGHASSAAAAQHVLDARKSRDSARSSGGVSSVDSTDSRSGMWRRISQTLTRGS